MRAMRALGKICKIVLLALMPFLDVSEKDNII